MKFKSLTSVIALWVSALMLSACAPEVPTVPTVPTTAAPVVKTSWGSTNCGIRENVTGSVKFAKAHFRILRSVEGSTNYTTVTLNSLPFRITEGTIRGVPGNRIIDKLKTLRAGESAKFTDEEFSGLEQVSTIFEFPTTQPGVYDYYSLRLFTGTGLFLVGYIHNAGAVTFVADTPAGPYSMTSIPVLRFQNVVDLQKNATGRYEASLMVENSSNIGNDEHTPAPIMFGTDTPVNTDKGNGSLNYFDFNRNNGSGGFLGVPSSFSVDPWHPNVYKNQKQIYGGARANGEQISMAAFSPNYVGCVSTNAKPKS